MDILWNIMEIALAFTVLSVALLFPVLLFFALDGVALDGHFANKLKQKLKNHA